MPAEVVEQLLKSRRRADINSKHVRPMEHPCLKDTPISIQRGQAETFLLIDSRGNVWVLKKFHRGRDLDRYYLEAVCRVLPAHAAFRSGIDREVLCPQSIRRTAGCYYSQRLANWLDGTVIMPRVDGMDWAALADQLRDGALALDGDQRLALCRGLAEAVLLLEQHQVAHRDLSSGNVFADMKSWTIVLIDFDSLYHPSLPMPQATTCGTVGYAPPYAWSQGSLDASTSWCVGADRYALALLCAEFLSMRPGAPLSAEGGIFEQNELRARSGPSIDFALAILAAEFPEALPLFEAAIRSTSFGGCPPPTDWLDISACNRAKLPQLADIEEIEQDYFNQILASRRPPAPLWPAPKLSDIPEPLMSIPRPSFHVVPLPPDPWSNSW